MKRIIIISLLLSLLILSSCTKNFPTKTSQETKNDVETTMPATETDIPVTGEITNAPEKVTFEISEDELLDKIRGGWIGQMVGVAWGASTEFCYREKLIPEGNVPKWKPEMINDAFGQDDLYVEIPLMKAMDLRGAECDPKFVAAAFKSTSFTLWHANYQARENLKNGIDYPDSGNYKYNSHSDDIDWQIECDFLGMMYPGMPEKAAERAFELGHIFCYGDGVYGGVYVSALHAAAFSEKSIYDVCEKARKTIPEGTKFRTLIDEITTYYNDGMKWEDAWQKINKKWGNDDICPELNGAGNIDAKLNSGFVLMGLLWGEGDFEKTIVISMRCGEDSDCNPSTAASILGNFYGEHGIDDIYKSALIETRSFATTDYSFRKAISTNKSLAEKILKKYGKTTENGFIIEQNGKITPVEFEQIPEGMIATLSVNKMGKDFTVDYAVYGTNEKVTKIEFDLGDGRKVFAIPALFGYKESGKYTVTMTAYGDGGSTATAKTVINAQASSRSDKVILCNVTKPLGGGSKNIAVIDDGIYKGNDSMQYDTYGGNVDDIYIGYQFPESRKVSKIIFTEGNHFGDGGWFTNGKIDIEICDKGGNWIKKSSSCSPTYPKSNFGAGFEKYEFTLNDAVECIGIRLIGKGGGSAKFISVCELDVE